jgi:hypothetical protein
MKWIAYRSKEPQCASAEQQTILRGQTRPPNFWRRAGMCEMFLVIRTSVTRTSREREELGVEQCVRANAVG